MEMIVDSFAGGGGAGLGIAQALGRAADLAINHDAAAIAMYAANHPDTRTMTEDVWRVNPRQATLGRKVGLLWASPDCKHFSRAKGGKPVEKSIRSLAWVVVKWAAEVRPRVIILENVREFAEWGPLLPAWKCGECAWRGTEGQATLVRTRRKCPRCESRRLRITSHLIPDPARKGVTFGRFVGRLQNLGYAVEWRNLNAADYGAPTHRRRLFLVARCDEAAIAWPEPTHGDPGSLDRQPLFERLKPWRTAAECIDWSIPCPSIFERRRPLADATLRRIALGLKRYVLENPRPFLVPLTHAGARRTHDVDDPLPTVTSAHRGELALATPYLVRYNSEKSAGDNRSESLEAPASTLDTQNRLGLVATTLIQTGYGEREGQAPRVPGIDKPLGTVVSGGSKHAVVSAFLARHFGRSVGASVERPCPTGGHAALVYSFLVRYFGTAIGQHCTEPLYTITGKDRFGVVLVTVAGQTYFIADIGMRMLTPRELARAQGFPDTYMLTGSKTNQVARLGNSVCPPIARSMVEANLGAAVGEVACGPAM